MADPVNPPPAGAAAAPPTTCIEAEPFALRVIDDSMAPEFAPGCVIVIDPTGLATDGAFVLAEIDGEYVFRQLRRTEEGDRLVALNDRYPAIPLPGGVATPHDEIAGQSRQRLAEASATPQSGIAKRPRQRSPASVRGVVVQRAGVRRRDHKRYD